MIQGIRKVIVPVDDQERAREFWTTRIGFEVVQDASFGEGGRWLEVAPPDGGPLLVLSPRRPDEPRRAVDDQLPHSDLFFTCADIEQTYNTLTQRGVRFPAPPTKMPFGWWSMFEDHEGTRYVLGQWS
jgi:predicted enzyme related to lactoylglutathione lyase